MPSDKQLESLFNLWLPSPLQKLQINEFEDLSIYVKRDDLIHQHISGNKFRKLKYNFKAFLEGNYNEIVAFGGPFSNLLYSLSFIVKRAGIPATFYVRGDGYDPDNPTLQVIKRNGVNLQFKARSWFRDQRKQLFQMDLGSKHSNPFVIPEGGSNILATPGSREILDEIREQLGKDPEYLIMDIGTAGTFSGVLCNIESNTNLIGIPVLKGVDWKSTIGNISKEAACALTFKQVEIIEDYHFGGFGKFNQDLINFINDFNARFGIPLDPIYTGKLAYGVMDLLKKQVFKAGSSVVWIHAGGNQGIKGFNYIHGPLIQE